MAPDTLPNPLDMGFVDVVVIGAGISGVNFAQRLQESNPSLSLVILEGRNSVGGTIFSSILAYDRTPTCTPSAFNGIHGEKIALSLTRQVVTADFNEESARWNLTIENEGHLKSLRCRHVAFGTGYYDYEKPMSTIIPGLSDYKGEKIHPQFWPENQDYKGKNIVVIGSGATAVTLLRNLAKEARHVTMLQRSPGYIVSMDNKTPPLLKLLLPDRLLYVFLRWWFLTSLFLQFQFCRAFPKFAKQKLKEATQQKLPANTSVDPHFSPKYYPWEQRLCLSPDNDFFDCLRSGKASVSTGYIQGFTEKGIRLESGETIDNVDIVVTATGLRMVFAGKIEISINGRKVDVSKKILWRGCMLEDIPNACFIMGYTNASWTLGADAASILFCRLVSSMTRS